jgi:hypothetical protein
MPLLPVIGISCLEDKFDYGPRRYLTLSTAQSLSPKRVALERGKPESFRSSFDLYVHGGGGGVGAKIDYVIFALFCRIKNKSEVSLNSSLFAEKTYSIGFFSKVEVKCIQNN